ncbi:MAG: hypothetical protein QNJ70_30135 [Xenococcaceae cyanobacterium MO_207.B15]|nr:hypothetical protein [Xenococcaceae cyanobacterium MO_207.B15]MDJ0747323.1 hypothetical protein [Xenococcaceae cyanobacterium MO_167.B27]
MKIKGLFQLCLTMSLVYVTVGDSFLPQPYSNKSQEVRGNINQFLISLFPDNELETLKRDRFTMETWERGNVSSPL